MAVLASKDGYVTKLLAGIDAAAAALDRAIDRAVDELQGVPQGHDPRQVLPPGNVALIGFAKMKTWTLATEDELAGDWSTAQTRSMVELLKARRYSRNAAMGFFTANVEAALLLAKPIVFPNDQLPDAIDGLAFHRAVAELIGEGKDCLANGAGAPRRLALSGILDFLDAGPFCVGHLEEPRLAATLCAGKWPRLVFGFVSHDRRFVSILLNEPSAKVRNAWLRSLGRGRAADEAEGDRRRLPERRQRGLHGGTFSARSLLQQLAVSGDARGVRNVQPIVDGVLEMLRAEGVDIGHRPVRVAQREVLRAARPLLDAAACLARRWELRRGNFWRTLSFDKSPQGVEVLCSIEDCVPQGASMDHLERRKLPIVSLAHAHQDQVHVVMALLHSIALEVGPDAAAMRGWLGDVRAVVTDQHSVESAVVDVQDCIDAFLAGGWPAQAAGPSARASPRLFPSAIKVLGANHLLDLVMRAAVGSLPFWAWWQARAKLLCGFLRAQHYRDALIYNGDLSEEDRDVLAKFSASFARWRWGTLAVVLRQLLSIRSPLLKCWSVELFRRGKVSVLPTVDATIRDETFWFQAEALRAVVMPIEDFRGWIRGCSCHEPGSAVGLRCPMKGRRAPQLRDELGRRLRAWNDLSTGRVDLNVNATLVLDVRKALGVAIGHVGLRFGFVSEMPWLVWTFLEKPTSILSAADASDQANRSEGVTRPHPVTELLLGTNSVHREPLIKYANTGAALPEETRKLVESYGWVSLDETLTESVHKDLGHAGKRAASSRLAWQASTVRLKQNLALYQKFKNNGRGKLFEGYLARWKAALQRHPHRAVQLRMRQITRKEALRMLYRTGKHAFAEYDVERLFIKDAVPKGPRSNVSEVEAMQVDFISVVFASGSFLTLPRTPSVPRGGAGVPQSMLEDDHLICIHVVDTNPRALKLLHPTTAKHMAVPVLAQRFSVAADVGQSSGELAVCAEGDVELIDVRTLAPWTSFWQHVREWQPRMGRSGVVFLSKPRRPADELLHGPARMAPALIVVYHLRARGWRLWQDAVQDYVHGAPKLYVLHKVVARLDYLLLLLDADRGDVGAPIPHYAHNLYYRCRRLLPAAECPPATSTVKVFKEALRAGKVDVDEREADIAGDALDEDADAEPGRKRRRSTTSSSASPSPPPRREAAAAAAAAGPQPMEQPAREGVARARATLLQPAPPDRGAVAGQAPAAAERPPPPPPAADPPPPPPPPPGPAPVQARAFRGLDGQTLTPTPHLPTHVGATHLDHEARADPGGRSYTRYGLRCPCANTLHVAHLPCHKKRNAGTGQTARFGALEPIGYLGAWASAAASFPTRDAHVAFQPSSRQIQDYLVGAGLLRPC